MSGNHPRLRLAACGCAALGLLLYLVFVTGWLAGDMPQPSSHTLRQLLDEAGPTSSPAEESRDPATSPPASRDPATSPPASLATASDTMRQLYSPGYIIENPDLCGGNGSSLQVLILVTSAPEHERSRTAIRYTWGHFAARKDVAIGFFLCAASNDSRQHEVRAEHDMYGDIVQSANKDGYRRLPVKTLSMLRWVDEHCPGAPFLLKTDDDVFVNVHELLGYVRDNSGANNTIFGLIARSWKPIRSPKSKYCITEEEFPDAVFPDFATGPAYLMTRDVVRRLYSGALDRHFMPLEDVLFTGLVAGDLGVHKVHSPKFQPSLSNSKRDACKRQTSVSLHDVKYEQQFAYWSQFFDGKNKC